MKVNFEKKYNELEKNIFDNQKKVDIDSKIKIFYGMSNDGYIRLSFLSSIVPPQIDSTKSLRVIQGKEGENVYWTCLDLINNEFKKIFFYFCEDIVSAILNSKDEIDELNIIRDRFYIWKIMFKKAKNSLSLEKEQGLFGELYFLYSYMIPKYGIDISINSWAGPLGYNKDFSMETDWIEVKTPSVNADCIKISSLSQLSSDVPGRLAIIKVEKMSNEFDGDNSSVLDLVESISNKISSLELKQKFLSKVAEYGFSEENNFVNYRFDVQNVSLYKVEKDFPRLNESDIKYQEINNIQYEIFINTLLKFKVEEL